MTFRFDETLFGNANALGASASLSSVLHVQRIEGVRLFAHNMESFEHTWGAGDAG